MIEYSESIVTFLDLLGFKGIVDDEPDPNRVNVILDRLTTAAHFDADIAKDIDLKTICVSDCVIRSVAVSRDLQLPVLQSELLDLIHIQADLLNCGHIVRGGVTIGKIFMDGNRVFGPAYQRAVQLENTVACSPRIIIDDALVEEFCKCPEELGGGDSACAYEELARLVRQDADGRWFIDYLRCLEVECEDADEYASFLRAHRRLVCDGLAANLDDKVHTKYEWLGRYHDAVVAEFDEHSLASCGVRKCELKVTSS